MSSEHGPQFFPNISNAIINDPRIVHAGRDINLNINISKRHGLRLLLENTAKNAFYDSAERGDPPKCHPRTRVAIRDELMQWIKDPQERQDFITWMYGPAGAGKTAIAQSIAEACAKERLLAASFFFGRLASGRNILDHFVPTIAYQISRTIPEIQNALLTAIENDPAIFSRSLSTQMQVLIINPLTSVHLASTPRVVVVDGVDECGPDDQAHAELLKLLAAAVDELRNVSILFLVGSRPEYEIRTAFNKTPLRSLTKLLALDDHYEPDKDIKIYFESKFSEICQEHLPLLSEPWPSQRDIHFLVAKASGQFIFAATVIKFIDNPRHDPKERLKIILGLSCVGNETPFALLDALYLFILRSVADVGKVLEILTMVLMDHHVGYLAEAEELLGFDIRRTMVDMHALVFVAPPDDDSRLHIHHASLHDFLMDQSRSLEFYIDTNQGHASLCIDWLKLIENPLKCQNLLRWKVVECFNYHYSRTSTRDGILDALEQLDFRASLEGICKDFDGLYLTNWEDFFQTVNKEGRHDVLLRLENVFDVFLIDRIAKYPLSLQTYIPIILFEWSLTDYETSLNGSEMRYICNILFYGVSKSPEEYKALQSMDALLLDLQAHHGFDSRIPYFRQIWNDKDRACKYFITDYEKKRNEMLMVMLNIVYSKPGDRDHQIEFSDDGDRDRHFEETLTWIEGIISRASDNNPSFANFLLERVVQLQDDVDWMPEWWNLSKISIEYIKKSGIPFLEHAHEPGTNKCAICDLCEGAIIVENTPSELLSACEDARDMENTRSESPSSPVLPPGSQSHLADDGGYSAALDILKLNDATAVRHDQPPISDHSSHAYLESDSNESTVIPFLCREALEETMTPHHPNHLNWVYALA